MKLFDNVKLIEEIENLAQKGIHKNYHGVIVETSGDIYTVCFYNPKNRGEYAFAKVDKKYLVFVVRAEDKIIFEMEDFFANVNKEAYTKLIECDVKEYDKIELLVEKSEYATEGVHKGMTGCVLQPYAYENKWLILFDDAGDNKDQLVEIEVDRKDFKIV